jgi:hypothetical protein
VRLHAGTQIESIERAQYTGVIPANARITGVIPAKAGIQ